MYARCVYVCVCLCVRECAACICCERVDARAREDGWMLGGCIDGATRTQERFKTHQVKLLADGRKIQIYAAKHIRGRQSVLLRHCQLHVGPPLRGRLDPDSVGERQ